MVIPRFIRHSETGSTLAGVLVTVTLSGIVLAALMSFVRTTTVAIARTNAVGAKEDMRKYFRELIDCVSLEVNYAGCLEGDFLEVKSISGSVLIRQPGVVFPTPTPMPPALYLPFAVRAICNTSSTAPSLFQIEVATKDDSTNWEILFKDAPPCLSAGSAP